MHPRLKIPGALALALSEAAAKSVRLGVNLVRPTVRTRRGQTLRPGPATPLWNVLAAAVRAEARRYGDQARLARLLGLPRQRVHELLRQRHLPDAERTLLLLIWLHSRSEGRDPA